MIAGMSNSQCRDAQCQISRPFAIMSRVRSSGALMTPANDDRPGDLSRFEQPLSFIPAEDRDTWLRVGMALHAESGGSAAGLGIWSAWSRTCPAKFDEANQGRTWKNFKGNRVTGGTIIKLAHENGYINGDAHPPSKRRDRSSCRETNRKL